MAAPPAYGDDDQEQELIDLLMRDNEESERRQDLVYDRADLGTDQAAPLPNIDWQSRPSKAMASAATSSNKADELEKVMQFSHAPIKAAHRSHAWNKRLIDFYLVYSQFMATYTSVAITDYFIVETLLKYAIPYLVIRAVKTKGMDSDRIKARTLVTWMDGLLNGIWQYAHVSRDDRTTAAKEVLFKHGLARRIRAKADQLIRVLGLSKVMRTKHILDLPDMLLLIDSVLYDTRFSPGKRIAIIQFITAWCIIMYTGLRPMSLAASNRSYLRLGRYMRLRNFKIKVNGASDWTVIVNATELKGHVVGLDFKDLTFELSSVKKTHNIMFCAATWVVLYFWLRGAFPQYKTLRELWMTTDTELVIDPSVRDEAFLLAVNPGGKGLNAGKPATADQISSTLSYHAHLLFMLNITVYALRRGLSRLLERTIGAAYAAVILGHKDNQTVYNKHYSAGTADINLVGIVTGEAGVQSDKPGMWIDRSGDVTPALQALLGTRWWTDQEDLQTAKPSTTRVKAFGKRGEGVILTKEQEDQCKPLDLEKISNAALEKFWDCFKPTSRKVRDTQNANILWNGIATGEHPLKEGVNLHDVKQYHTEAIRALANFLEQWKVQKRFHKSVIAKRWLAEMAARPAPTAEECKEAAERLKRVNEDAIKRLVSQIPTDAAEEEVMTKAQMDVTLDQAFEQENDDLEDVLDEYGRADPLPPGLLNNKFATRPEIEQMVQVFDKPLILPTETAEEQGEQPLLVDSERTDDGLDDTNDVLPGSDIIAVRRELMELAATPILCERDGRPIPGVEPHLCAQCNKEIPDLWAYREHMRRVHSNWQNYVRESKVSSNKWKCGPCNRSWNRKGDFIKHALNNCSEKERNQGWWNEVKEYTEANAARMRENRARKKAAQEGGPEAVERLLQQLLPDGLAEHTREGFKSSFNVLPSMLEVDEALTALKESCASRSLNVDLAEPLDASFDHKEAFAAHAENF